MEILRTKASMRACSAAWRKAGWRIGFVPTMGALHEGHGSLIRRALTHADRVVVSLFVNPTQFGPGEDFEAYPRDETSDLAWCRELGVHAVFLPQASEMYDGEATVVVEECRISRGLCGVSRPGHFRGVLTVVAKLFNLVGPDLAVFGQKDAQQLALIRRMVRDLDMPVQILEGPIVREPDGLAMSSRNARLSPEDRVRALCLRRALDRAEAACSAGERDAAALADALRVDIEQTPGAQVEYVACVDADTFEPLERLRPKTLVALAVRLGGTRLIDNTVLGA